MIALLFSIWLIRIDSGGRSLDGGGGVKRANERQAVFFRTFNPLTPGGTIYLAFIFLIPLTVGKSIGRRRSSTALWAERLLAAVQRDPSLYNTEMGFIDGNRAVRKAWNHLRRKVSWRNWRRRNQKRKKS